MTQRVGKRDLQRDRGIVGKRARPDIAQFTA